LPKVATIEKPVPARRELAKMAKDDFRIFIREAWKTIEPGTPLLWNWHIDAIADHLTAVLNGEITRLVVNIAPGHMKSTLFSVMWPAWAWTTRPDIRWLCASHSLGLAIRDNRNCRSLIKSDWYQACYRDAFSLAKDQNAKSFFENNKRGYRLAVSVGSKSIGRRGSHLLIDDPNDAKASKADIEKTLYWFGQTWLSRLNDQENGAMVITGQRLDEEDLSGYVLKNLNGWEHLNLPTEYESTRKCFTSVVSSSNDPYAWKGHDPREKDGELLWEQKFPPKVLANLKEGLGSLGYSAQHQQAPVPASGGTFKKEWARYFEIEGEHYILHTKYGRRKPVPIHSCRNEAVCDLATSERDQADYFVIQTWAITLENECLLLHQLRGHFNNPEQQKKAIELYERFRWARFHVEKVAYQLAYIQQMRNYEVREEVEKDVYRVTKVVCMPVCSWTPFRDKEIRAGVAAVKMEAGDMYWLMNAPYLQELEPEIFTFPKSKKKDQVDCHSMIADILSAMGGPAVWSLDKEKDEKSSIVSSVSRFEEEEMEEWEE
jgi:hypothetical protein